MLRMPTATDANAVKDVIAAFRFHFTGSKDDNASKDANAALAFVYNTTGG